MKLSSVKTQTNRNNKTTQTKPFSPATPVSIKLREDGYKAIQSFILNCEVKGLSKKTIKWYRETLTLFLGWLKANQGTTAPKDISREMIWGFIVNKRDIIGLAPSTINNYLRALKCWLGYLVEEEALKENVMKRIQLLKVPETVFLTFTPEHIQQLLKLQNPKSFIGVRNYAIILIFIDTGIRLSELTGIKIQDVNLESRVIKVFGKGSKERMVPFGSHAKRAIVKYLDWREGEPHEHLFIGRAGKPLRSHAIQNWLERDRMKVHIPGIRISAHTFRHSFAVQFLRNGGDAFSLQRILGHTDPKVSFVYAKMAVDGLQEVHRKASPGDNLM